MKTLLTGVKYKKSLNLSDAQNISKMSGIKNTFLFLLFKALHPAASQPKIFNMATHFVFFFKQVMF